MTGPPDSHPAGPHLPQRPAWNCRHCAKPWPCPAVRVRLRTAYGRDLVGLAEYLSTQLFTALGDLHETDVSPELLHRFLGWTEGT